MGMIISLFLAIAGSVALYQTLHMSMDRDWGVIASVAIMILFFLLYTGICALFGLPCLFGILAFFIVGIYALKAYFR